MAISYFGVGKTNKDFVKNHTRTRKLKQGHLITTDYGSWAYLTEDEFNQLKKKEINEPLANLLKEKGIILTENNINDIIYSYREKLKYLFQGTSLQIVVPTLRCNIRCIYCHSASKPLDSKGYDMDEKTAKKTVDFIFQSPSEAITIEFQGGDPLIRFDIVKYIVKYAKELNKKFKKNLKFSIVTNLILMDDKKFDFLKKENIGICTSLDGCKEVHNKNRQEYDKTILWIKKIMKQHSLNAMLLATKHTLPYHKEIVDGYAGLGLKKIWIKPVNNLGYAQDKWGEVGVNAEEYLKFYRNALDYIVKLNKKNILVENYTLILLRKILTKDCVNFTDLQSPCGAAIGQLAYNYNGNIHTCDEGRRFEIFKIGTVDDRYEDVLSSPGTLGIVKASINDNPVCETCAYKPYCGLCPICSYAETKNIISKLPNRRCEILKGMFDYVFDKLLHDEVYRKVFFTWLKKKIK